MTTKKTPIVDKLLQQLKLVEKIQSDIPFANKMDTGIDTDSRTQVWRDTHKKFQDTLGLTDIKNTFGQPDANKIEVPSVYGPKDKNTDKTIANALFDAPSVRTKKIDLLEVREAPTEKLKEDGSPAEPYIWRTSKYETLTEASAVKVSYTDKDFYRIGSTDTVFTRNPKFPNCYFAVGPKPPNAEVFLYNSYGAKAKGGVNSVRYTVNYIYNNYKQPFQEAIDVVKSFTQDPETKEMLERLKQVDVDNIPITIFNSLSLGVLDAANIGVHSTNESLEQAENKIGWQILDPTSAVRKLQSAIFLSAKEGESLELSPVLATKISEYLKQVGTESKQFNTYDPIFRNAIKETIKQKKFNIRKTSQSAKTQMSFILAQILNQLNKAYARDLSFKFDTAIKLYLDRFGFDAKRLEDFQSAFGIASLVHTTCPIVVLRGIAGDSETVYSVDPTVVDLDVTKTNPGTDSLGNLKPLGLTSLVHQYIIHKAESDTHAPATKQTYIDTFYKLADNTTNIQGARNGPAFLKALLNVVLNEDLTFKSGVLFAGLSPLFWDRPGGKEIKVAFNKGSISSQKAIQLPFKLGDTGKYSTKWGYYIESTAEIFYDRILNPEFEALDPKNLAKIEHHKQRQDLVTSIDPIVNNDEEIKKRQLKIITESGLDFISLQDVRNKMLQTLYTLETSDQEDMKVLYNTYIIPLYNNVQAGFWILGDKLACYDPWHIVSLGGPRPKTVTRFRFLPENTSDNVMNSERAAAIEKFKGVVGKGVTNLSTSIEPLIGTHI